MINITVRLLQIEDTDALLDFETTNRAWFEQWVPPRPAGYFTRETLLKINEDLVAEATAGTAYMHLILNPEGRIIGRINLTDIDRETATANLGYRVAQDMTGNGVAVKALRIIENLAQDYGFETLQATCLATNPASAAVLDNRGFKEDFTARSEMQLMGKTVAILCFRKRLG